MVPSAILSVFLYDEVIHLTLDSGCTGNIIRLDVVERLNIPMKPTKVKARQADNKTFLDVRGQISVSFVRGKISFKFDAIVVKSLGPEALAGTPFQKDNDIMTDFVNEQIIVKKKIRFPFTTQHMVDNKSDTFLVRILKEQIILPGESIDIKIPKENPPDQMYAIENRQCKFIENSDFEAPIVIKSVGHNVKIPNHTSEVIKVKKHSHIQVRRLNPVNPKIMEGKHEYPVKPNLYV